MIEVSDKILSYLNNLYGEQASEKYLNFIEEEPALYIRVNNLKISTEKLSSILKTNYNIQTEKVENINNALKVLNNHDLLGKTIEHINGLFYIQSLSSMLPPIVLNPNGNEKVLDLCAAPGSKSTEISELMNNRGTLILNEIQLDRVKALVYNVDRMDILNAGVIHSKGETLSKVYDNYFDKILVDAPCSGLGIIQKKNEVSNWWSLNRVDRLADLQLRLLIAAVKMLKPGGEVVYSTCTLTPEENEAIVNKVLTKYPVEIKEINLPVSSNSGFTRFGENNFDEKLSSAKRIIPWEANSDGFFIAKLVKTEKTEPPKKIHIKKKDIKILKYKDKQINTLLKKVEDYFGINEEILNHFNYLLKGNDIFFINNEWELFNPDLFQRIGIQFGTIDNKGELNLHTNAAQFLNDNIKDNIYKIENQSELKTYLEGGIIKNDNFTSGQYAIKFQDFIIGTAIGGASGLKSRFPRSKRTQQILTDF